MAERQIIANLAAYAARELEVNTVYTIRQEASQAVKQAEAAAAAEAVKLSPWAICGDAECCATMKEHTSKMS
jgi:hypothetical protein